MEYLSVLVSFSVQKVDDGNSLPQMLWGLSTVTFVTCLGQCLARNKCYNVSGHLERKKNI